jgi:hypothetical protein
MRPYQREMTTELGDNTWVFSVDAKNRRGFLTGNDVDWHEYPVIDGVAFDLVLSEEESAWLLSQWTEATVNLRGSRLYGGLDTELHLGPKCCYLGDDYCPICLRKKAQFHIHHCIATSEGGLDEIQNLLRVCRSCHALITSGGVEDSVPRYMAAFYHQLAQFGVKFFPRRQRERGRSAGASFFEHYPEFIQVTVNFDTRLSEQQKAHADSMTRNMARVQYIYFRDMARGLWSWEDHRYRKEEEERRCAVLEATLAQRD